MSNEDYEILVGNTNRTESIETAKLLTEDTYILKYFPETHKIVIIGYDDSHTKLAAEVFMEKYLGYNTTTGETENSLLSIPANLNETQTVANPTAVLCYSVNESATYRDAVFAAVREAYPEAVEADTSLPPEQLFDIKKYPAVVIAGCDCLPIGTKSAIETYLENGGKLLLLGGPAFTEDVYSLDGKWLTKDEYLTKVLADAKNPVQIFDTSNSSVVASLSRSSNSNGSVTLQVTDDAGFEEKVLSYEVQNLDSWDYLSYKVTVKGSGAGAIGLWAKGAEDTGNLYIEVSESDGTRWYTTITLTDSWNYYLISASDFTFWTGDSSKAQSRPDLSSIRTFCFGFAQSGIEMAKGHHSFCLAKPTLLQTDVQIDSDFTELSIDGVSPDYELYPITNLSTVATGSNQIYVSDRQYTVPESCISCVAGRQGVGYGNKRQSRFVPLIQAYDAEGYSCGYVAWMHIYSSLNGQNGSLEGSIITTFGATSADFYNADGCAAVVEALQAMLLPVHLVEGGTNEFLYTDTDKTLTAGAVYTSEESSSCTVQIDLYQGDTVIKTVDAKTKEPKTNFYSISESLSLSEVRPDRVVVTLFIGGRAVDRISHEIQYYQPTPEAERHYISSENGYFVQNGERIRFFGVNYYPSDGLAESNDNRFYHYALRSAYDPDVIQNDLERIKSLGMNAVALSVSTLEIDSNNFLDLLMRCRNLGLYCDVYIGTTSSDLTYGSSTEIKSILSKCRLAELDNIIAYDVLWELRLGTYDSGRSSYDDEWRDWIVEQYGSLEHAEKLWGVSAPTDSNGEVIGLSDSMLNDTTGKYDGIAAAYWRFLDDVVAKSFLPLFNYISEADTNHMASFRMSMAGSARQTSYFKPSTGCFDFMSLAPVVSFMEPEGYALDYTNDDSMLQILFATAYARYAQPDSPVVWKEYGKTVWNGSNFNSQDYVLENQRAYYEAVLSHALVADVDGMFAWHYAGGYRSDEKSDYGILNPDGSDRPCTEVLRKYAKLFLGDDTYEHSEDTVTIEVERDDATRGIFNMFDESLTQLRKAYAAGNNVTIVNRHQEEFADTLLDYATGGTEADGQYPLRYVNGIIESAEWKDESGETYLEVVVTNTMPSVWRAGTISVCDSQSGKSVLIEEDVYQLESVTLRLPISKNESYTLRLYISGTPFGSSLSDNEQKGN